MKSRIPLWVVLLIGAMAATLAAKSAPNPEDIARRHYELGVGFVQTQKLSGALKGFQTVVDSYPSSSVAGDSIIGQPIADVSRLGALLA